MNGERKVWACFEGRNLVVSKSESKSVGWSPRLEIDTVSRSERASVCVEYERLLPFPQDAFWNQMRLSTASNSVLDALET